MTERVSMLGPADISSSRSASGPGPGAGRAAGRELRLPRRTRRVLLIVHIAVSVGWLGVSLCLLVLGVTARATPDPATAAAAYRAMNTLAGTLLIPVSLSALLTGVCLAVRRPWGLTRYYWILAKLLLTLLAAAASIFALPAVIAQAVHATTAAARIDTATANNLVIAPTIAVATYTAIVAISVLKPWGRISKGLPLCRAYRGPSTRRAN